MSSSHRPTHLWYLQHTARSPPSSKISKAAPGCCRAICWPCASLSHFSESYPTSMAVKIVYKQPMSLCCWNSWFRSGHDNGPSNHRQSNSGHRSAGMVCMVSILLTDLVPLHEVAIYRSYVNIVQTVGRSCGGAVGGALATSIGWRW